MAPQGPSVHTIVSQEGAMVSDADGVELHCLCCLAIQTNHLMHVKYP